MLWAVVREYERDIFVVRVIFFSCHAGNRSGIQQQKGLDTRLRGYDSLWVFF